MSDASAARRTVTGAHLSPSGLAERLGVPLETVYLWNRKGTGPRYMKVGIHVRYRLSDVEAWEESRLTSRVRCAAP